MAGPKSFGALQQTRLQPEPIARNLIRAQRNNTSAGAGGRFADKVYGKPCHLLRNCVQSAHASEIGWKFGRQAQLSCAPYQTSSLKANDAVRAVASGTRPAADSVDATRTSTRSDSVRLLQQVRASSSDAALQTHRFADKPVRPKLSKTCSVTDRDDSRAHFLLPEPIPVITIVNGWDGNEGSTVPCMDAVTPPREAAESIMGVELGRQCSPASEQHSETDRHDCARLCSGDTRGGHASSKSEGRDIYRQFSNSLTTTVWQG